MQLIRTERKTPPLRAGESSASVLVIESCSPAGPAEIHAGGAVATTKPPTNVSDDQGGGPRSGSPCSAQQSPGVSHGERSTPLDDQLGASLTRALPTQAARQPGAIPP